MLAAGDRITTYVAIRADEDSREGYAATHKNLTVRFPFRESGIDKRGVLEILESVGVGLPKYYEWRSRSGCTFCFFQQKIEWVRLRERHPEAFEDAKRYEKSALEHGSPFTWTKGEALDELEKPARIRQIVADHEERRRRELSRRPANPLRPAISAVDIDDIYGEDEGGGACAICHK
jgi:hypothetical protein